MTRAGAGRCQSGSDLPGFLAEGDETARLAFRAARIVAGMNAGHARAAVCELKGKLTSLADV